MNTADNINIYCGCTPSIMDGTEHILKVDDKLDLPDELSWEKVMPPVRNQGKTQTCVCQSLTGVLDYLHNTEVGTDRVCNNYSIDELFNCRKNKNGFGMSIKEALYFLRHTGLNGQKINSYSKITSAENMRYALLMFGPCVGGLPCYSADYNNFWRKGGQYCGGHCITFVGYTKTGFIIRNSWGTTWGEDGYWEMPYKEFETSCFEAWTITL